MIPAVIRADVEAERRRQDGKWGEQNHDPSKWAQIIAEEFGEASKEDLQGRPYGYRREMVELAASVIAAIESFDRTISQQKETDVASEELDSTPQIG